MWKFPFWLNWHHESITIATANRSVCAVCLHSNRSVPTSRIIQFTSRLFASTEFAMKKKWKKRKEQRKTANFASRIKLRAATKCFSCKIFARVCALGTMYVYVFVYNIILHFHFAVYFFFRVDVVVRHCRQRNRWYWTARKYSLRRRRSNTLTSQRHNLLAPPNVRRLCVRCVLTPVQTCVCMSTYSQPNNLYTQSNSHVQTIKNLLTLSPRSMTILWRYSIYTTCSYRCGVQNCFQFSVSLSPLVRHSPSDDTGKYWEYSEHCHAMN